MRIIVDAMGGDHAPNQAVLGAIDAVKSQNVEVVLVGRGEVILETLKEEGVQNLQNEKYMKMAMNALVIVIFLIMNIILISIKMLSELDARRRRADFLTCMGMYKKDRDKLIMKEVLVDHHLLPAVISMAVSLAFTLVVCYARAYETADILNYMKMMVPMWAAYLGASTVILTVLSMIYARTVEGKKYARRS